MSLFGKKKSKKSSVEIGFKGGEVHVNPDPLTRKDRNAARMKRLEKKIKELEAKGNPSPKRLKKLKIEYNYRKSAVEYAKEKAELEGGK